MARRKQVSGPVCRWTLTDTGQYDTDCGECFEVSEGTPAQNHMQFCCYCGRKLTTQRTLEEP